MIKADGDVWGALGAVIGFIVAVIVMLVYFAILAHYPLVGLGIFLVGIMILIFCANYFNWD